jgi:hypothetical protein
VSGEQFSGARWQAKVGDWLVGVLLAAAAIRLALWAVYQPVAYSDSPSYRRLALAILDGWDSYDGTRTPGYPAFLALLDPAHQGWEVRAWLAQMILGMCITLLLFYLGWQVSGKPWLGGAVALTHTFNLGQLFFEANLLTETLTTFWIMLTFAGLAVWLYHPTRRSFALAFGVGLASALAAITRPLFIYLPAWILLFVLFTSNTHHAPRNISRVARFVFRSLAFAIPVIAIVGGWVNFIHSYYGDWGLSAMTGYHLIQHTGNYFEYVPDDYAALRDAYLKYREIQIARHGSQTNAIWEAIPEMTQASGLHFYDLNRTLAKISIQLIREHPDLYLKNVLAGWWMFWRAPVYWQPEALRWPGAAAPLRIAVLCERALLFGSNLIFIATSVLMALLAILSACRLSENPTSIVSFTAQRRRSLRKSSKLRILGALRGLKWFFASQSTALRQTASLVNAPNLRDACKNSKGNSSADDADCADDPPLSAISAPSAENDHHTLTRQPILRRSIPGWRLLSVSSLRPSAFLWCLLGSIWMASIIQTLLDHGDNPRFLIPLQSLVVLWLLWLAAGWKAAKR